MSDFRPRHGGGLPRPWRRWVLFVVMIALALGNAWVLAFEADASILNFIAVVMLLLGAIFVLWTLSEEIR